MPSKNTSRSSYAWKKARKARLAIAAANGEPCCMCHRPIDYTLPGTARWGPTVDHSTPLAFGGTLVPGTDQLRPAHNVCQQRQGAQIGNRSARRKPRGDGDDSGLDNFARVANEQSDESVSEDSAVSRDKRKGPRLLKQTRGDSGVDITNIPEPRFVSPPHPKRAGSLGPEAIAWIEERRRNDDRVPASEKAALPWWTIALERALEVDDQGRLLWKVVVLTVPRQSAKTSLMSEVCLWRAHQAPRFGERQHVLHAGNRLVAARRAMVEVWPWAQSKGYTVKQAMGREQVILPDGSAWEVSSLQTAYGSRVSMAFLDEAFDVDPEPVEKALWPTMVQREQPQLWLVSTANDEATDLIPSRRHKAMSEDGVTCLIDWGIEEGADPQDMDLWPLASPVWSEQRLDWMQTARRDSDFEGQWLNRWPDWTADGQRPTWPVGLDQVPPVSERPQPGCVVAVEVSLDGKTFGVAAVASGGRGIVNAVAFELPDLNSVREWVKSMNPSQVWAGKSIAGAFEQNYATEPFGVREVAQATPVFEEVVLSGLLRWNLDEDVIEQSRRARMSFTDSGPVLSAKSSKRPIAALKAMAVGCWVVASGKAGEVPQVF